MIFREEAKRNVLQWPALHSAPMRTGGAPGGPAAIRSPVLCTILSPCRGPPIHHLSHFRTNFVAKPFKINYIPKANCCLIHRDLDHDFMSWGWRKGRQLA